MLPTLLIGVLPFVLLGIVGLLRYLLSPVWNYGDNSGRRAEANTPAVDTDEKAKDFWDILKTIAVAVGAVAIPVVLAMLGNQVSVSMKDRDVRLRTVELAIGILREDPKTTNRETKALRQWAMDVIDSYSGIPLPPEARSELQKEPIVRSRNEYSCLQGKVRLQVPPSAIVAVTEQTGPGICDMSVNSATPDSGLGVRCTNFKASVWFPRGYVGSVTESKDFCEIHIQ
jgi:hypothetical protein